jgi:Tfp pilus assembly protein PilZ
MELERSVKQRRQRHPRVSLHVPARISSIDPELEPGDGRRYFRICSESCLDLSRGGALIRTGDALRIGARVLLELDLPGAVPFQAVGRVTWAKIQGPQAGAVKNGIEFTEATRDHILALEKFIARSKARTAQPRKPHPAQPNRWPQSPW